MQTRQKHRIQWIGLPPKDFRSYRSWINRGRPGICGTYCASVLLHYTLHKQTGASIDKDIMLKGMKEVVDDLFPYRGTFFWDIANGLRRMLNDTDCWKVRVGLVSERIVPKLLSREKPVPVIVGTTKFLNSPYKNHWVVVYAYGYDEEGKLFYRCYDNHGKYQAILPASQTISCVWVEEVKEAEVK